MTQKATFGSLFLYLAIIDSQHECFVYSYVGGYEVECGVSAGDILLLLAKNNLFPLNLQD